MYRVRWKSNQAEVGTHRSVQKIPTHSLCLILYSWIIAEISLMFEYFARRNECNRIPESFVVFRKHLHFITFAVAT